MISLESCRGLEASACYVESHYDFLDAKSCRSSLDHLRNRAARRVATHRLNEVCILLKSTLQRSLEAADSQVQDILWQQVASGSRKLSCSQEEDAVSVDTEIFYTAFHMIAPTLGSELLDSEHSP